MKDFDNDAILNRIKVLLHTYDTNANKICSGDTSTQVGLNRVLSGKYGVSLAVIMKLLGYFPNVSADWLLLGVGPMERDMEVTKEDGTKENICTPAHVEQMAMMMSAYTELASKYNDLSNKLNKYIEENGNKL